MSKNRAWSRIVASTVVTAMLAAYAGVTALPAQADPPAPIAGGLQEWFGYLGSLADRGAFGAELTGTRLNVGAADAMDLVGLGNQVSALPWADKSSTDAVAGALDALDGSYGPWQFTTSAHSRRDGAVDRIAVDMTVTRTVDTGLELHDPAKAFDLSSPGGVAAAITLRTSFTAAYSAGSFWIDRTPASVPTLTADVAASIPNLAAVTGGLGILGVHLGAGSTFSLTGSVATGFADPDGDGKLAFTQTGGAAGELAAPGSAGGIATPTLSPGGSLQAHVVLTGDSSTLVSGLPALSATVDVASSDLASGAMTASFATNAFDAVKPFQSLSPKDLADSLGQLTAILRAAQRSVDVPLPLMRGTLADALPTEQALTGFLTQFVEQHPTETADLADPTKYHEIGKPKFASVQDLAAKLQGYAASGGAGQISIDAASSRYDTSGSHPKLRLTLKLSRRSTTSVPLDVVGPSLNGSGSGVTYGNGFLRHAGKEFPADLAGRQITAGTSAAVIDRVDPSDKGKLLLSAAPFSDGTVPAPAPPAVLWKGGIPDAGTAYSIAGEDPKTGQVEFADLLRTRTGLTNANGSAPVATIKPSYDVTLPLVLDLVPPTVLATPQTVDNPDGTKSVITSTPTLAQRIMLNTGKPLVAADLPIETDVKVAAKAGFLQVDLGGRLTVCTKAPGVGADCSGAPTDGTRFLSLRTLATGDAQNDIALPQLFDRLRTNPTSLVNASVNGKVAGTLTLSTPGVSGFFPGGTASATLRWDNLADPAAIQLTAPDLSKLLAMDVSGLDDPARLFGALLQALRQLDESLHASGSGGPLDKPIPVLGKSLHDLLSGVEQGGPGAVYTADTLRVPGKSFAGYEGRRVVVGSATAVITAVQGTAKDTVKVDTAWGKTVPANDTPFVIGDNLLAALDQLAASPSTSLNEMLGVLRQRLGNGITLDVAPAAAATPAQLKLGIDWTQTIPLRVPLDLKLSLPNVPSDLIGTSGNGTISISATGRVRVGLLLPLTAAAIADPLPSLRVDPASSAHVKADVDLAPNSTLKANLGPLALSIGNPSPPAGGTAGTSLHGRIGYSLASGSTSAQTVPAFLSGLQPTADNGTVTCDGVSASNLALCAALPVFYRDSAGTWQPIGSGFTVALPRSATPDQFAAAVTPPNASDITNALSSQLIDLRALGDGLAGYLRLLDTAISLADTAGKIPVIGKDVQQGLNFIGGVRKSITDVLPVDANAGALAVDSEEKIQQKLDQISATLPGSPSFSVSTECNAKLLPVGNLRNDGSTNPTSGTVAYSYRIVAVRSGNTTGDARSSNVLNLTNITPLTAASANKMTWDPVPYATGYRIERKQGSDPWKVMKTIPGTSFVDDGTTAAGAAAPASAGSDPTLRPCPGEAITGFRVKVLISQGNPDAPGGCTTGCEKAATKPLDLGLPGLSVSTTRPGSAPDLSDPDNGVSGKVGWKLQLSFGLTKDKGFVVYTQDSDTPLSAPPSGGSTPELLIGAALTAPKQFTGRLAFLNATAVGPDSKTDRSFSGAFGIDLHTPTGTPCPTAGCARDAGQFLTMAQITQSDLAKLVSVELTANTRLRYTITVDTDAPLPGIRADFHLTWGWTSTSPDTTGNLVVGFDHVRVNPGVFLGEVLKPVLEKINALYGPVKPVLDTVSAPIPVLSDLSRLAGGQDVSILTLAQVYASSDSNAQTFDQFVRIFKTTKEVLDAVNAATSACTNPPPGADPEYCINLGSFNLLGAKAFSVEATPASADQLLDQSSPTYAPQASVFDQLNTHTGGKLAGAEKTAAGNANRGFAFPALKNPELLFGLLLGQDVELASFDSGQLTLGFSFSQSFGPVYAPPPVLIVISGSASVTAEISAGFDTFGIRKAVENADAGAATRAVDFLDSLYFKTVDAAGAPLPVITFRGELAAGAAVTAVVITVGVVGGIGLTVAFFWNDQNNDGKFRFSEFLATALNNPICLFNVGGGLSLFLKVFITVGYSPFSVSFDFTLADITLLDFSIKPDCAPPPPKLGGMSGDTLYLFAGNLGTGDLRGHPSYDNSGSDKERFVVREHKDDPTKVTVSALGITQDFTGVRTVVLDGTGHTGPISALFQGAGDQTAAAAAPGGGDHNSPFTRRLVVVGGDNADVVKTGSGEAWISGGGGDDQITTGDRPDLATDPATAPSVHVAGGGGNDTIAVGNADNVVAGDGDLPIGTHDVPLTIEGASPRTVSTLNLSTLADQSNADVGTGNDRISVGLGRTAVWGGGGDDVVGAAADSPLAATKTGAERAKYVSRGLSVHGGGGSDRISTGSGADVVHTGTTEDPTGLTKDQVADRLGSGDVAGSTRAVNTVDTGTAPPDAVDTVYGSDGDDVITGHSAGTSRNVFYGAGGLDILMGGTGRDELFGGPGDDYLVAEPSTLGEPNTTKDALGDARTVRHIPSAVTPQVKLLVGGGGSDRIYGGDGGAKAYGDRRDFTCSTNTQSVASDPPGESGVTTSGSDDVKDAADLIYGGEGVDDVNAGGGDDHVEARGGKDVVCGSAGSDSLELGNGDDTAWGGSGADTVRGSDGADKVFGNAGDDTLYGGKHEDVLEGNNGADTVFGGANADVVVGGTRAAGRTDRGPAIDPDKGDSLFGDTGADLLIGDNGVPSSDPSTGGGAPHDLGSTDVNHGNRDRLFGGADNDAAYGGLDRDLVDGGPQDDHLEGNPGADTVLGGDGADDLVGGSSQLAATGDLSETATGRPDAGDELQGGDGDDVIAGDNAQLVRVASGGALVTRARGLATQRTIRLLDLGYAPASGTSGDDVIAAGDGTDVVLAQGGQDTVRAGEGDDYAEGGPDFDTLYGEDGHDDLVGGSTTPSGSATGQATVGQPDTGDRIEGGAGGDVVLGDNGAVLRDLTEGRTASILTAGRPTPARFLQPYDLEGSVQVGTSSGGDVVLGGTATDVVLGQAGDDRLRGDGGADFVEGGAGSDWVEGDAGDDDLVGGSSTIKGADAGDLAAGGQPDAADALWGGAGDDVLAGDNALLARTGTFDPLTRRVSADGGLTPERAVRLLDLSTAGSTLTPPDGSRFGADQISGGSGVDVAYGQDGNDAVTGGGDDDYVEGNGGKDALYGDLALAAAGVPPLTTTWPGEADAAQLDPSGPDGQDDLLGGSSRAGFRDADDDVHGNGGADFILGDNGSVVRDVVGPDSSGGYRNLVYVQRYPAVAPAGAAYVRHAAPGLASTRPCAPRPSQTCEPDDAWGGDRLSGGEGDDVAYGQDGDDVLRGGGGDDDLYGELGDDRIAGDDGNDAILGDRGAIVSTYQDGSRRLQLSYTQVPKISYSGYDAGTVTRRVDQLHDLDPGTGTSFAAASTAPPMPYDGITIGGADTLQGGAGNDSIHGEAGDDIANGDSGGDWLFGGDGADVLWGGKGGDDPADPNARGDHDSLVDYLFGGKGGTSDASRRGASGSDLLDFRPRSTTADCVSGRWPVTDVLGVTRDPCLWLELTRLDDSDPSNNQHHSGIDWMYGGWDRDVLQGDVADNGPNPGDRLLDWNGAFNLYTHCNAAYGGFNDVRQHSPAMQDFLQRWSASLGAGQADGDTAVAGTSGFNELALVYNGKDNAAATGPAYPTTPGHFDQIACTP